MYPPLMCLSDFRQNLSFPAVCRNIYLALMPGIFRGWLSFHLLLRKMPSVRLTNQKKLLFISHFYLPFGYRIILYSKKEAKSADI